MQNSFVIDKDTKIQFAGRTLLLDTNALLDAYRLPQEFYSLASEFTALNCNFVTTKSIAVEFLGGTTDTNTLTKKRIFLESMFGRELRSIYLPVDRDVPDLNDFLSFSRQANRFSIVDFELYCTLKKYGERIALVTRNHKDFSTKLVKRVSFITLLGTSEIHTYSVHTAS